MRAGKTLGIAAASVALLAGGLANAAPPVCVGLEVDGVRQGGGNPVTFSATKVVDLTVRAHLGPGLTGTHLMELRLLTPDGHLYQSIAVPVSDPKGGGETERAVAGYPHPVKVSPAQQEGGGSFKVERGFPVGGTQIVRNGLYGVWTAQAIVDGARSAACPAASFRIIP